MGFIASLILILLVSVTVAAALKPFSLDFIRELSNEPPKVSALDSQSAVEFYGKLVNTCDEAAGTNCFNAVVAGGRTNFIGDGGDLANIYVPWNDYDTWRQKSTEGDQISGEFYYQLQNSTLSCLTVQVSWFFGPGIPNDEFPQPPQVSCQAVSLASNWDCHLDWAVTAQCTWNREAQQVEALYSVVNLGPEKEPGAPRVSHISQQDGKKEIVHVERAVTHPKNVEL
jgi:hypothetical protein